MKIPQQDLNPQYYRARTPFPMGHNRNQQQMLNAEHTDKYSAYIIEIKTAPKMHQFMASYQMIYQHDAPIENNRTNEYVH